MQVCERATWRRLVFPDPSKIPSGYAPALAGAVTALLFFSTPYSLRPGYAGAFGLGDKVRLSRKFLKKLRAAPAARSFAKVGWFFGGTGRYPCFEHVGAGGTPLFECRMRPRLPETLKNALSLLFSDFDCRWVLHNDRGMTVT